MQAVFHVAPFSTASIRTKEAGIVGVSALLAAVATLPLLAMIVGPVTGLVDGAPQPQTSPIGLSLVLLAPVIYVMFAGANWAIMRDNAPRAALAAAMKVMALGLMPYVALSLVGIGWEAGPRESFLIAAALTLPAAAIATLVSVSKRATP